ncbi:hypothetical protein LF1_52910 [Rubripirellula obstinata]|uniref:PH domain-containing protein n=1 Tax=Rubripirellula obstinata TaxID=406547 RepID=A0A5B1C860_9BACT|nr:hypothetical protein [Rubripirellula obstinata]KAA1257277.1 hypothetical protein LF1_54260 [Rubripirellula obstinata]KAA1257442.1 hypothetical protein LF1_52910 [Rubripirellula obstinata]
MPTPPVVARYGTGPKAMTIGLAVAASGLAVGVYRTEGAADAAILLTLFLPPLALLAVEFWFIRIEISGDNIRCSSPYRPSRSIPITDVTHIDFASLPQWFRIHTNDHGTVRLHGYLAGLYDVLNHLESAGYPFPRVKHVRSPLDSI